MKNQVVNIFFWHIKDEDDGSADQFNNKVKNGDHGWN